jgi:hypothetical protein
MQAYFEAKARLFEAPLLVWQRTAAPKPGP